MDFADGGRGTTLTPRPEPGPARQNSMKRELLAIMVGYVTLRLEYRMAYVDEVYFDPTLLKATIWVFIFQTR